MKNNIITFIEQNFFDKKFMVAKISLAVVCLYYIGYGLGKCVFYVIH